MRIILRNFAKILKLYEFIKKLQGLPEEHKKVIVIAVVAIFGVILGFFWVKSTGENISKIGQSLKSIDLPKIEFEDVTSGNSPNGKIITDVLETLNTEQLENSGEISSDGIDDWKTHASEKYGYTIKHPDAWKIDQDRIKDTELHFLKEVDLDHAIIDIEIVSQTRNITSAESALDAIAGKMKEVTQEKKKITVGDYVGYEAIGTLCTAECSSESSQAYSLLSIIYFSDSKEVFYIDYIEELAGSGYKGALKDWKYYDEFKNIISTFKSVDTIKYLELRNDY